MAAATSRGSHDANGFARDMQNFIVDLEVSAKSIIKRETKRRISELKRQAQVEAVMRAKGGGSPSKSRKRPSPTRLANPSDEALIAPPVTFTRSDMTASVSGLLPFPQRQHISTPPPLNTAPMDALGATAVPEWTHGPDSPDVAATTTTGPLPPLRAVSKSSSIRRVLEGVMQQVRAGERILPVLFKNPLYKPPGQGHPKAKAREIQSDMKLYSTSGLMNLTASKASAPKPRKEHRVELQGPISWCSDDIRIKYRSEEAREAAWVASKTAEAASEKLRLTEGVIMPFPVVERHPLYTAYFNLVKADFRRAIDRARARNRLKRFVSDVHTVWMTNLAALREFSIQIQSVSKGRSAQSMVSSTLPAYPIIKVADPVFTRPPPRLPAPPPTPCSLWTLVDRELLHVKSVQRQYHCFAHRLLDPHSPDHTPLWRVALYDRADGTEMVVVTTEEAAVKAVKKHILQSADRSSFEHRTPESRNARWVHRQVKRVDLVGGGKACGLLQITVHEGPHETVLVEITAFLSGIEAMKRLVLKLTTEEVKARLNLTDALSKDVGWWMSTRHRGHDLWKPLISLLQLKTQVIEDGSRHATELVFNDQEMREKEGFDVYGMMAMASAFMPLARVTPVQKRYGMAHSLAFPDVDEVAAPEDGARWEERSDFNLPLSVRVCGRVREITCVPGTCLIGKEGLWYRFAGAAKEYTQPAACFIRDKAMSSTDSVLGLVVLGLDTPTMTPPVVAWEMTICNPPPAPEEEPDGIVPPIGLHSLTALKCPFISLVDTITAPTMMALTIMCRPLDYATPGLHRRLAPPADDHGFALQASFKTLVHNPETPTYIFTITERGATPNLVRTTGRYIWHSEQRCLEEIVRRRTPKDFAYISKKRALIGANDPRIFTAFTRHGKFDRLIAGGYSELVKEYEAILATEEKKRKEEALRLKIEAANARVLANKFQEESVSRALCQKELRTLQKQAPARKRSSIERWNKRLTYSILLGLRDTWEKRRHEPSGNIFYHSVDQRSSDTFTHDPPPPWLEASTGAEPTVCVAPGATTASVSATATSEPVLALPEDTSKALPPTDPSSSSSTSERLAKAFDDAGKKQSKQIDAILEDLATNDVLISKLADKIGAYSFVPLLKRDRTVDPLDRQLEEDDRAWSDSDDEVGDDDYEKGYLLQDWKEKYQEDQLDKMIFEKKAPPHIKPDIVPKLPIIQCHAEDPDSLGGHALGKGWRRLPRPEIKEGFIAKLLGRRTERCLTRMMDKPSTFHLVGAQDPGQAVVDSEQWITQWTPEVRFIDNVLQDVEMSVDLIQARFEREERLARGGGLSQILASGGVGLGGDGMGAMEKVKATQEEADVADNLYKAEKRALAAVAAGDFERLEAAVDDDHINLNTMDEHGNTLLILAAQQGNKRMVKFLLRRGANINMQNFAGNSVLHYAFAYNHEELGKYLESKGADISFINAQGLTCYEGLNRLQLDSV